MRLCFLRRDFQLFFGTGCNTHCGLDDAFGQFAGS
jgi:hypothetical protein